MKFVKQLPTHQGYYWYVDMEYPVPQIGFRGPLYKFYNSKMQELPEQYLLTNIRFGDRIEEPSCETNLIEK